MKRFYQKSFLLVLFAMVGQAVSAYDCYVNGIYYDLDKSNKTASVTFLDGRSIWNKDAYKGAVGIPSSFTHGGTTYSVTSIGVCAFSGCSGLTSITIGNSVTSIDDDAFYGCI